MGEKEKPWWDRKLSRYLSMRQMGKARATEERDFEFRVGTKVRNVGSIR